MANKKLIVFSLCLLIFIDSIGGGLIYPIMPDLFLSAKHGLVRHHEFLSRGMMYGLAFALFPLGGLIGMPVFGVLSDVYDRKKVILVGLALMSLTYFCSALVVYARDPYSFLFIRFVDGLCVGTYAVATAVLADISENERDKAQNFAWPMVASVAGFIVGPLIGAVSGFFEVYHAFLLPFVIAFILSVINVVVMWLVFRKDITSVKSEGGLLQGVAIRFESFFYIYKENNIRSLRRSFAFFQFGVGLFVQSISIFLVVAYQYTILEIGLFFSIMGIGILINALVLQPYISKLLSILTILKYGVLAIATMLFIQGMSVLLDDFITINSVTVVWVGSFISYLVFPLVITAYMARFTERADKSQSGGVIGGAGQVRSLNWFMSGILVGFLAHLHESLVLLVASAGIFIAFLLLSDR